MSDFVSSGTTTTKTSSDIEIDGVPMPGLKLNGLTVTKEKIWSKNTGRAANGEMVGDLIAIKYTLKCSWPPLTREQAVVIDKAVSPAFFNVTFLAPGTNTKVTKRFYAGAPAYPVYTYRKGVKTYQGVAVDLIQK